ncbi:MAG TPA: hypothetical protein VNI01_11900 [Elusimicrobiota bacterium]|jgi:Spy/CpxP family protein refolding chaperone|nr:hypothetical protein [Elusimicrobiota bacterium]
MKRAAILAAAACALLAASASAQPPDHEEGGMREHPVLQQRYLEGLNEQLKLTDKQKLRISSILDGARPDLHKRFEDLRAMHERMRAMEEDLRGRVRDLHEKVRAELDPKQRERFDEMRERMGRGPSGRGERRRRPGPREEDERDLPHDGSRGMREKDGDKDTMPPPEMWHQGGKPAKEDPGPGGDE